MWTVGISDPRRARTASGPSNRPVQIIGARPAGLSDVYHYLVRGSWGRLLGTFMAAYLAINILFGALYAELGGVANARPGSFADAFFFSVQTLGTIGYGFMYPSSMAANTLVTVETLLGMVGMALMTGLVFAKFSRPRARILYSKVAVISERNGVPTLMFRMANERSNYVAEATMRVAVLKNETTREGEFLRRTYDLQMMRSTTPAFVLTWQGMHQILEGSPLYGMTPETMRAANAEILVSVTGLDESTSQVIHARHAYTVDALRWNERLADVMGTGPDGIAVMDYRRFHETVPQPPTPSEAA